MPAHDHYAELCSLAAIGELAEKEYEEFQAHLEQCRICRQSLAELHQIICSQLPQTRGRISEIFARARTSSGSGAREAFLRRARSEGISFSPDVEHRNFEWFGYLKRLAPYAAVSVMSASIAIASFVTFQTRVPAQASNPSPGVLSQIQKDNAALNDELQRSRHLASEHSGDVANLEQRVDELAAQRKELEKLLREAQGKAALLNDALAAANLKNSDLSSHLSESSNALSAVRSELDQIRSSKSSSDATLAAQQAEIQSLSEKLRLQSASLQMDKQLLTANRDVRDLMGARNLHITDVHDFDASGKQSKVFGRIFYTEGKSLIFYAFDLGEKRLENARYSFQAWGQQEGNTHPAKSLGLFYLDDKSQKRWVLRVDDAELLQHIDSVFVTLEPDGGGKKPSGQKLMYAYVGNQPNHP